MAELSHFFPLTAYKAKLGLKEPYRAQLIENIEKDYRDNNVDYENNDVAWTGDTKGFEFLHSRKLFQNLFRDISKQVEEYYKTLKVSENIFDFYYTRTWATVTHNQQDIPLHHHAQSHITVVYYLKHPKDSGELIIEPFWDHVQNEFIPGLLTKQNFENGVIEPSIYLSPGAGVKIDTDDILIFPSKTRHGTAKSKSQESRISISADIVAVLKDSSKREFFLPPLDKWKKFS